MSNETKLQDTAPLAALEEAGGRYDALVSQLPTLTLGSDAVLSSSDFLADLDAFWSSVDDEERSRTEQFAQIIEGSIKAEAQQKKLDRLLFGAQVKVLLAALVGSKDKAAAYRLELGGDTQEPAPLAGALLFCRHVLAESEDENAESGVALLYLPGSGLHGFESLQEAVETLDRWMLQGDRRQELMDLLPHGKALAADDNRFYWRWTSVDGSIGRTVADARVGRLRDGVQGGLQAAPAVDDTGRVVENVAQELALLCRHGPGSVLLERQRLLHVSKSGWGADFRLASMFVVTSVTCCNYAWKESLIPNT
jgi:hypothetical protein